MCVCVCVCVMPPHATVRVNGRVTRRSGFREIFVGVCVCVCVGLPCVCVCVCIASPCDGSCHRMCH